jgi:hypothetical protein
VRERREEKECMAANGKSNGKNTATKQTRKLAARSPLNGRWVYAYQLDPPQPEPRFRKLRALIRQAQLAAKRGGRLWTGRIVVETLVTHLLIVTNDPTQVPAVNRAIEAELKQLDTAFALSGPAQFPVSRATPARQASRSSSFNSSRLDLPLEKISALRSGGRPLR